LVYNYACKLSQFNKPFGRRQYRQFGGGPGIRQVSRHRRKNVNILSLSPEVR
jgi:hypothetical protein